MRNVQDATNFGFKHNNIGDWKVLAATEVPEVNADDFFSAEPFMVASVARTEALRVLKSFERYTEANENPKEFGEWINLFVLSRTGTLLDNSNPMSRSTSLMSNLHDQMRAAFWTPVISRVAEEAISK